MSGDSSKMSEMRSAEARALDRRPAYLAYSRTGRMEFFRYEMNTSRSPAVSEPAITCSAPCHSTRAVAQATSRSMERSRPADSRLVFMSALAAWPSLPRNMREKPSSSASDCTVRMADIDSVAVAASDPSRVR